MPNFAGFVDDVRASLPMGRYTAFGAVSGF